MGWKCTMRHPDQVAEILEYCRENMCMPDEKRVCFVCGRVPESGEQAAVGVFIADEAHQRRLGAPSNKTRLMIYLVCGDCYELPDRNERVEQKIFAVAGVQ